MDLVEFIRRFMPKTPARVFHPALEWMATEARSLNGLTTDPTITDDNEDEIELDICRVCCAAHRSGEPCPFCMDSGPLITADDRAVFREGHRRESMIMEILAHAPVWHAYEWYPSAVRNRRIRAIYARVEPWGA